MAAPSAYSGRIEQNQVILQISDTGIGIPAIDLPYIFDKFYRATNASSEMSGTGLGLAIVKSIVENHGGRVWVEFDRSAKAPSSPSFCRSCSSKRGVKIPLPAALPCAAGFFAS